MGCGASSEVVPPKGKRERGGPDSPTKQQGGARRTYSKADSGARRGSLGDATPPPVDPGVLSQALLADLRTKGTPNAIPIRDALSRWVENICPPSDGDNPDLYDPVRRHRLCMDSVEAKKKSARLASIVSTGGVGIVSASVYEATGGSTSAPSVADSEAGVSEDKTGQPHTPAATTTAATTGDVVNQSITNQAILDART